MNRPTKYPNSDSELYASIDDIDEESKPYKVYVEGPLDRLFYKRFSERNFACRFLDNGFFKSCKKKIINHIKECRKPGEYGLVDKDFDEPSCLAIDGLFFTDTHDLETLLFSKDNKLMLNIFRKHFLLDVEKSKYIAYQIGIIKKALYKIDRDIIDLPSKMKCERFIARDNKINLKSFCEYMIENDQNTNIDFETLKNIDIIQAYFSPDNFIFNRNKDDILAEHDLWDIINGHDLSIILRSANKEIDEKLPRRKHGFEETIVKKVDTEKFKTNTDLYDKMKNEGLF